jgi:hypothetical protein
MGAQETVRKYMETLTMVKRDREEVENVILGYMSDCEAKDKRIDKLASALEIIAGRKQCADNTMSNVEVAIAALDT